MLTENLPIKKMLGLDAWGDYTGEYAKAYGLTLGTFEGIKYDHGYKTWFITQELLPGVPVLEVPNQGTYEFIKQNKVIAAYRSLELGYSVAENMKFPPDIQEYCLLLHAAGNDYKRVDDSIGDRPEWYLVAASSTLDLDAQPYSNRSDDILCSGIGTWTINDHGITSSDTGTSFATPEVATLCYYLQDLAIQKRGFPFSGFELEAYIKDFAYDVAPAGFDVKTGHGFFRLPPPETIDVYKYVTVIEMIIGDKSYSVNDETKIMDVAPVIFNSRTMVPIRFIAEALNAKVEWDDKQKKVTIIKSAAGS